jgi:hypothetical protein
MYNIELLDPAISNCLAMYYIAIDVADCMSISNLVILYPACSDD